MLSRGPKIRIEGPRTYLRMPQMKDREEWVRLRQEGAEYLRPWEPVWAPNHFSRKGFRNRVYWARKSYEAGDAFANFIFRREDDALIGAITLDNIRRGPAQTASVGYWIGQEFNRQGFMSEALKALTNYAFSVMDLSRIEAATLPENEASRGVLEKSGFKYEGVAQSYLQINGRWRTHVLYASLRNDRRGTTDAG